MELITSQTNRWLKCAMQLKHRKYRDKFGLFVMEGIRSVYDSNDLGIEDCICFFTARYADDSNLNQFFERAKILHWKLLLIDDKLMKLISSTEHSQGILLIVKKEVPDPARLKNPMKGRYVLLDSIQDPGNIGTIIRTAAAAEVKGILLTKGCTDAYSDKAVRSSMGSILRIPVYENISLEFLQDLKKSGISFIGTALKNALPYKEANVPEDCIFVFGNEGNGISPEILAMTDFNVYIPIAGVESLNVAIASAIILFHFKD